MKDKNKNTPGWKISVEDQHRQAINHEATIRERKEGIVVGTIVDFFRSEYTLHLKVAAIEEFSPSMALLPIKIYTLEDGYKNHYYATIESIDIRN